MWQKKVHGGPQNLKCLWYDPFFTESMLTPENVTQETTEVSEENTVEPRKGEIFPNDSKSRSKREKDW